MSRPLLIDISEVIRNGVVFNLRKWQEAPVDSDKLAKAVSRLFSLLNERKVDYVLVGGIAMLQYVEGRNTQDIDLIVSADALDKLPEAQLIDQQPDFARLKFEDLRLDFLFTTHPLFDLVTREYSSIQPFEQGKVRCATVEGILLLKLYALPSLYRQGRFARVGLYENDVATLLQEYKTETSHLVKVLSKYLSASDLAEVKKILAEIRERIQRFEERSNGAK